MKQETQALIDAHKDAREALIEHLVAEGWRAEEIAAVVNVKTSATDEPRKSLFAHVADDVLGAFR